MPAAKTAEQKTRVNWVWAVCCVIAAAALAVTGFVPLWRMALEAPQYPAGLEIVAYGTRLAGDVQEMNDLNHYIGAMRIEQDDIPELKLFPFLLAGMVGLLLVGAVFARRRSWRVLVALAVWSFPIGLLADLQWWLWRLGHTLAPDAPMRALVEGGFTPPVLGESHVVNFESDGQPALGLWLMLFAAVLVSFGPPVWRFVRDSWGNTGTPGDRGEPAEEQPAKHAVVAVVAVSVLGLATVTGLGAPAGAEAAAQPATSIAALIAAAEPGATVVVPPGRYHEQVVVDRSITLVGEGWPVIDGGRKGDVVRVTAPDVVIRGLEVRGSSRDVSHEPAGIRLVADRATVEGNRLRDVLYGIVLQESDGHVVRDNDLVGIPESAAEQRGHGLYLWYTQDNLIAGNRVAYVKDGIFVGFATANRIERNHVSRMRYGIHYMYADGNQFTANTFRDGIAGAALMYSRDITFRDNEFAYNRSAASGYGLLMKDVDNLEMTGNLVHHNRLGMTMEGAPREPGAFVRIRHNAISFNQVALELGTTTNAEFTDNTFRGNLEGVRTRGGSIEGRNLWATEGRGNYWDDYQGFDRQGDGVGDLPYRYEEAYESLASRNVGLRAYAFTPAATALDLAARWFPVFRPAPNVVDPHPLMAPTVALPLGATDGRVAASAAMAAMAGLPLLAMLLLARGRTLR